MNPPDSPAKPALWGRDLFRLALAFCLVYFFVLGRAPLANPDEGRYGEIPREMLASGDWVTPRLDGVNYFEKPPLMYWAVAAAVGIFGGGEGSLRSVPALFGVAGILVTYAATRRLFGRAAGLGAAVVLGTSALYAGLARILVLDMAVSILISATLFCFVLAVREPAGTPRRWLFYGLYASAALATLTKGLMGFLIPGAVMLLWLALCDQWRRLRPLYLPSGLSLFVLLSAPWHIAAAARNPTWANFYFVHEHWQRFTTTAHSRFHPWYWFIPILLGGLFPWLGWLWAGLGAGLAGGWRRRKENAERWFFVIWSGFIFAFFSASMSKLAPYILPVFPALAVLIALVLGPAWREHAVRAIRVGVRIFSMCCGLLAGATLAAAAFPERLGVDSDKAAALRPIAYALAAVLLAGGAAGSVALFRGKCRPALVAVVATMVLFLGIAEWETAVFYPPSAKPLALWVKIHSRPDDRIFSYAGFFHDFVYYSERPDIGAVGFHGDEVELINDPKAAASGRFIEKPEFLREWTGPGRMLVVARCSAPETGILLADRAFHYHLLTRTRDFYLFSNRP